MGPVMGFGFGRRKTMGLGWGGSVGVGLDGRSMR